MELTGEQLIRAPRQKVWDALNDPDILSRCIPGCKEISKVSDTETHTRVMLKIGPVRATFAGKIFMSDIDAPSKCTLIFEGAGGAAGFANGRSAVALTEEGDGTRLSYSVDASVGGKLGQIGGRLIDSSAKKMADEFFAAFDGALAVAPPAATAAADVATPAIAGVQMAPATALPLPGPGAQSVQHAFSNPGFRPELYRVFWFSFGALFTLLVTRWLP